jgi:hypothetical protein
MSVLQWLVTVPVPVILVPTRLVLYSRQDLILPG